VVRTRPTDELVARLVRAEVPAVLVDAARSLGAAIGLAPGLAPGGTALDWERSPRPVSPGR
jgi:hypothetical protein